MYHSKSAKVTDFKIFRLKSRVKLSWPCHLFTQLYFSLVKKKNFFNFFILAVLQGMWDLSSLTRVQTYTLYSGRAGEVPIFLWFLTFPLFSHLFSFSTQHEISMSYRPITMLMAWATFMFSNSISSPGCVGAGDCHRTRQSKSAYQTR